MRKPLHVLALLALVALSGGLGYAVAGLRADRPGEAPSRAIAGAAVPAGLAEQVHAVLLEPDLLDRTAKLARILEPLGPEALDPVRAAYRGAILDTGDVELVLMLDWWARFDPAGALDWARDSRIGWHPAAVTAVARAWARQDPEAASQALVASIQDERLLGAAMAGLVRGWAESGRDGLEDHLAGLPGGTPRGIDALARARVARADPESVIAWVEGLPEDDPRQAAFKSDLAERVVEALADSDPEAAGAWVARRRADSPGGRGALPLVLRLSMRWAQRDGAAALRWLASLPPDGDSRTAVQETFRAWYFSDQAAATEWIRTTRVEPWLDPALATFALQQSAQQPDEALAWANRVSDPQLRERTLVKVAASYSLAAPDAAPEWLARAQLPDPVRERVQQILANRAASAPAAPMRPDPGGAVPASPPP